MVTAAAPARAARHLALTKAARHLTLAIGCVATLAPGCRRRAAERERTDAPPPVIARASADAPVGAWPARAFYFWRTVLRLSQAERRAVAALGVTRLYVRMFDVDWDDRAAAPRPLAPLQAPEGGGAVFASTAVEPVPVVFIRERVLRHLAPGAAAGPTPAALAADVWREIDAELSVLGASAPVRELQIDCDWTDATRAPFFALLEEIAARARPRGVALSATIRLHQVKFRERTGVPPVARGMLMLYNVGAVDADPDTHAIFDPTRAAGYLGRLADYPLPLDVALPIWSWALHVRGDRVLGLLQDTDRADLERAPWLRPAGPARFQAVDAAFIDGEIVRAGDFVDVDETTTAAVAAAAALAAPRLAAAAGPRTIALFHLSEKALSRHDTRALAGVFASFARAAP